MKLEELTALGMTEENAKKVLELNIAEVNAEGQRRLKRRANLRRQRLLSPT